MITKQLRHNGIPFSREVWSNDACTIKVPWTVLDAKNGLVFFFAKDKLFKIYVHDGNYRVSKTGVALDMDMMEARKLDKTLTYNEWNEDWSSEEGYWLEDSLQTKKVVTITVFIKELLDDDVFE